MKIAILGATSQIAKDLMLHWSADSKKYSLSLFARNVCAIREFLCVLSYKTDISIFHIDEFEKTEDDFSAIINFIGVGDPSRTIIYGCEIMDITYHYDNLVMSYLSRHPECKYLFMSSGAVYGNSFFDPVSELSSSTIPINNITSKDFYSIAKLYSESRHRAKRNYSIIDIRIFNIYSRNQSLDSKFFITDIVRSIRDDKELIVSPDVIVRDFIHPKDFQRLVDLLLIQKEDLNLAVDCYSKLPVDKFSLLEFFSKAYGLKWRMDSSLITINATGNKKNYYSKNRIAEKFGYSPFFTSLEAIKIEADVIIKTFHEV